MHSQTTQATCHSQTKATILKRQEELPPYQNPQPAFISVTWWRNSAGCKSAHGGLEDHKWNCQRMIRCEQWSPGREWGQFTGRRLAFSEAVIQKAFSLKQRWGSVQLALNTYRNRTCKFKEMPLPCPPPRKPLCLLEEDCSPAIVVSHSFTMVDVSVGSCLFWRMWRHLSIGAHTLLPASRYRKSRRTPVL